MMQLETITRQPDAHAHQIPLLFVHGIVHGAWCWDEHFLPYFAQHGYHATALSLRNHGASEKVAGWRWLSIRDYVADVAQVAQQIHTETGQRPIVIGHSMGGLIVQKYLETYDAPAAILLASCPSHGVWQTMLRTIIKQPLAFLETNLTLNLKALVNTTQRAKWAFFSDDMPDTTIERYRQRFDDESYRVFLDMLLFALPKTQRIQTPLLVLAGADDTLFSVAEERSTAASYHTDFRSFEGMAHDMMLEKDWQAVADAIIGWLEANGYTKNAP